MLRSARLANTLRRRSMEHVSVESRENRCSANVTYRNHNQLVSGIGLSLIDPSHRPTSCFCLSLSGCRKRTSGCQLVAKT